MEARLRTLSHRRDVIGVAATPERQQRAYEDLIDAIGETLAFYDSLPRRVALRTLPDVELRKLQKEAVKVDGLVADIAAPVHEAKAVKLVKDLQLYERMCNINDARDVPLNLFSLYERVILGRTEQTEYWCRRAERAVKMLGIVEVTLRLSNTPPQDRNSDDCLRRAYTSRAVVSRFNELQLRTSDAFDEAQFAADDAHKGVLEGIDAHDLVRQLSAFKNDTYPAFKSTTQALEAPQVQGGEALAMDTMSVLEGVLGRLFEFAAFLDDAVATLHTGQNPRSARLKDLLDTIVERTAMTANEVTRTLQTFAYKDTVPLPLPQVPAQRRDKHAKGKRRQGAGVSPGGEQAQPATEPALLIARTKILVRSELGTQHLADVGEAAASSSSSSSNAGLQAWQQPFSKKALQQWLDRLDEMLAFDLPGQQRTVSQARRTQDPEAARHVTELAISRLYRQAAEMDACIRALEVNRRFLGVQLPAVHQKLGELNALRAQAQGQAKVLRENLDGAEADHLKTYRFPTQAHIEKLLSQGQLIKGELQALKGEPGTLFELKLQPSALRNGILPKPIWLHIHTKEPVHAYQLATLEPRAFGATHLKSDEERGRNREWQDAQARTGHENALVYRGKISPELCGQLVR